MSEIMDRRIVLGRCNKIQTVRNRLEAAQNSASAVSLNLREIGILITVLDAGVRVAKAEPRVVERCSPSEETIQELRRQLHRADQAWQAAERQILKLECGK